MRYFAYGSNLDAVDLAKYCVKKSLPIPKRSDEKPAFLSGWKLTFNFFSASRMGGVANLAFTGQPEDRVYGALCEVADPYMKIIDLTEGAPQAYERIKVEATLMEDPVHKNVVTYVVLKTRVMDREVPPTRDYLFLIVKNAKRLGFPREYIKKLESVQTV